MNKLLRVATLTILMVSAAYAAMDDKSIRERTAQIGSVCLEGDACGSASAAADAGPKTPEEIYAASCGGCHNSGVLGAPKIGDAAVWTDRLGKGLDQVIANAIGGINGMPAMGTCASCSEDDIAATVQYMVDNSK